jgi:Ankyrin repeats (many copies)
MVRECFLGLIIFSHMLLMGMEHQIQRECDSALFLKGMPIVARYCDLRTLSCLMRTNPVYCSSCDVIKICPLVTKTCRCSTVACAELSQNYYLCSRALAHCAKKSNIDMFGHLWLFHRNVRASYALDTERKSVDKLMYRYVTDYGTQQNAETSFNELVLDAFDAYDADGLKTVFKGRELYIPHVSGDRVLRRMCRIGDVDLLFKYFASYGYQYSPKTLQWIIQYGSSSIVDALIKNGSLCADEMRKDGMTAVHFAVIYDRCDNMKVLLDHGFRINIGNTRGKTPLHYAAQESNVAAVRLLLEHDANVYLVDNDGKMARDYIPFLTTKILHFLGEDRSHKKARNKVIRDLLEQHRNNMQRHGNGSSK